MVRATNTSQQTNGSLPSLCEFMCKGNSTVQLRAHVIYFWQRAFNAQPDLAEKYPSITVRQTEITLRVFVVNMGRKEGVVIERGQRSPPFNIYIYFFRLHRKFVNIHWTLSLPFSLRQCEGEEEGVLKSHCQSSRRSLQLWHRVPSSW